MDVLMENNYIKYDLGVFYLKKNRFLEMSDNFTNNLRAFTTNKSLLITLFLYNIYFTERCTYLIITRL